MKVVVREAQTEDLESILALYAELHPEDPRLTPEAALPTWERIMDSSYREVLLACCDGEPLGTVEYTLVPNLTRGGRWLVIIENLVVRASSRGTGIGALLLGEVKERIADIDVYKIQLSVGLSGPVAFYIKQCYAVDGLTMKLKIAR
ncbi:GNAT family N-acetyltransferase [Streptomyces sp. NRRL S-448]|uniref:GNAT family N-acetyltransferase n=1 Tax=Streptomyces sp. NRRL S-448 TaxID=1463907 RepID=UPI0035658E4A